MGWRPRINHPQAEAEHVANIRTLSYKPAAHTSESHTSTITSHIAPPHNYNHPIYRRRHTKKTKSGEGEDWASGIYGNVYRGPGVVREERVMYREERDAGRSI
jgi:hypothetical protein